MVWYGSSSDGALLFCNHARHWLTQPTRSGASKSAIASCSSWDARAASVIERPPRLRLSPLRCPPRGCNSRLGTARRRSSDEEQERQQRAKAVGQVDRDSTLLDHSRETGQHFGAPDDGEVEHVPPGVADLHRVSRREIEWRRQMALESEKRFEYLPDR